MTGVQTCALPISPAGQLEPRGWLRCRWAFRWVGWVFAGLLGVGLGVLAAGSSARLSVHSQAAPGLRSQIHEVTEEVKERLPPDGLLPGVQFPWTARARWRLRLFPLIYFLFKICHKFAKYLENF